MKKSLWIVLALFFSAFVGCGSGGQPVPPATGLLYLLDHSNKAVYVLNNIDTINGSLDPVRTLSGDLTLIQDPSAIAVDSLHDTLYVADSGSDKILVFIPASSVDGNVAPRRTFPGPLQTGEMYYDQDNDSLYVVDVQNGGLAIWDAVRDQTDGTAASRTAKLGYTPSSIFVDGVRNILYAGDPGNIAVNAYSSAASLSTGSNFVATVNRVIQDATQPFAHINSLTMNVPNDFLYVTESQNPSVEIFNDAENIQASPAPTARSLEGDATGMGIDTNIGIFNKNVFYLILTRTNLGIWNNANEINGNVAPDRNLHINPATELVDFAIDLNH